MHFLDIILKKRNGFPLTKEEIQFFISSYVDGDIPDYQVAALLMAIWFTGMDSRETTDLTLAMRDSGETIDLSDITGIKVDKHSTGGVADTTTLITAPIVAACGLKVAKISGRGLGHTGGTIDKLEAIPGFSTSIERNQFKNIVDQCGMSIIGQTDSLVPADKLLYALRDVTGTVDNRSLISSSIMSKKLASGADSIVLDVKCGNGSFMREVDDAVSLATIMVKIGKAAGKNVHALVTDMNQPLGLAIGNALEVREAIEVLQGKGNNEDLKVVAVELAASLIHMSEKTENMDAARALALDALETGKALKQLQMMIKAQGGNHLVCEDLSLLPQASQELVMRAEGSGYLSEIATKEIGIAALLLGAGRSQKTDIIDPAVGIWMTKRLGDYVDKGDCLATFHVNGEKNLETAKNRFLEAITLGEQTPGKKQLIYRAIS